MTGSADRTSPISVRSNESAPQLMHVATGRRLDTQVDTTGRARDDPRRHGDGDDDSIQTRLFWHPSRFRCLQGERDRRVRQTSRNHRQA
jgi:hypothetical protein